MNWWSVILKAPIDLRQAGYDLHATRMEDVEGDFNRLYVDLDNVLSVKINKALSKRPSARKLSAVINSNTTVYKDIKELDGKWQRKFNQSVYPKIAEKLKEDYNSSNVTMQDKGGGFLIYMDNPRTFGKEPPEEEPAQAYGAEAEEQEQQNPPERGTSFGHA
tara:strand:- start:1144 stop:1629 length:486 start_codon:yes stop_codon:yes gene_type:complete